MDPQQQPYSIWDHPLDALLMGLQNSYYQVKGDLGGSPFDHNNELMKALAGLAMTVPPGMTDSPLTFMMRYTGMTPMGPGGRYLQQQQRNPLSDLYRALMGQGQQPSQQLTY